MTVHDRLVQALPPGYSVSPGPTPKTTWIQQGDRRLVLVDERLRGFLVEGTARWEGPEGGTWGGPYVDPPWAPRLVQAAIAAATRAATTGP